jgi:transposase-like protein
MSGWRDDAACAGMDTEAFFASAGRTLTAARAVCLRCSVAEPCAREAASHKDNFGIWAGRNWTDGRPEKLRTDPGGAPRSEHPPELRDAAVALYRQLRGQHPSEKATLEAVAVQLDLPGSYLVYDWVSATVPRAERRTRVRTGYGDPERAAALAMLAQIRHQHPSLTAALKVVGEARGVHWTSIRGWLREAGGGRAEQIGAAA